MKNILNKIMAFLTIVSSQIAIALCCPVAAAGNGVLGYDIKNGTIQGGAGNLEEAGTKLQDKGNTIVYIIIALVLIAIIGFIAFHAAKLAKSGDNPQERTRAISNAGWNKLISMLRYKCERYGKVLIQVDPAYTSQTCSTCGCINSRLGYDRYGWLKVREWKCPECGAVHDRDVNAAVNIREKGMAVGIA